MDFNNTYLTMQSITAFGLTIHKSIDYAYALTIHKSQGSTFRNVYVDASNIRVAKDRDLSLRLLYTALSRATNKAIILL